MITLNISFVEETEGDWIPTTMVVAFETEDTDQAYELAERWISIEADKSLKHMIAGTLRIVRA